ncbi:MAG: ShlB/FhaC/HecB family hemolysin secretion/activation protein [Gammaproteobacteria bacterium]|nr:ShlB/FhaC/HecB family hemolysin secretion/activation protein [Gammaproteobacteria bacterium]
MLNKDLSAIVIVACALVLIPGGAIAQNLPGGATPGGALPDLGSKRLPDAPEPGAVVVPSMLERLEQDVDEGVKIRVKRFDVIANRNPMTAWRKGTYLDGVEKTLASNVVGQPADGYTLGQIGQVIRGIQNDLRQDGMMLAQVFLPVQTVVDGVVTVQIMEGRVGKVITEGNERYKDKILQKPVSGLAGRAVDSTEVEQAILLLRDYPGIAVAGVLSPGSSLGTTDLTLRVQDEDPFNFDVTIDNYGSEFTGESRVLATFDYNNATGHADVISLAMLQTYDPEDATYGSIEYLLPVFWPGTYFTASYVQNVFDVSGGAALGTTNIEGDTRVGKIGFSHSIVRSREQNLSASINLISKRATIDNSTSGVTQAEDKLTVLDVGVNFDMVDKRFRGINSGYLSFSQGMPDTFGSLTSSIPGADLGSSRQNTSRTSAGGKFDKWTAEFARLQQLGEHSELLVRTSAQVSDDLIVSLEQFSMGGPNSVRAFPPAEYLVDTGGFASVEWFLAAPGFADKEGFRGYTWGELLRFSLFYDYAGGYLSEPAFGEQKTRDLNGYGFGIDFRLPGTLWARLDIAKPRGTEKPSDGDDPQLYFSFNYSF